MLLNKQKTSGFFNDLADILNQSLSLYKLANKIDWGKFERAFESLFRKNNGRSAKFIRLMCGLVILKYLRNISDELVLG